ncbi:uncharacterized protein N0V89_011857 [Didymosphaeria variabile]|uniref:Uncharacterized protein n=1 Tax=Didymosphaeria variabile TaxID=1932322 RepID=A0A9W9C5Q6_9PLEO|nr:uncharacterized protein N0V89_011857 [Didymosphaeria variabile]KAJ4345722.1 hypothetical protein N0V89_011857 [Didymosphaeria variabile]
MIRPLTFYDLPLKARKLVYHYLGWSDCTVDLNYNQLVIFPQETYPDKERVEKMFCFHDGWFDITHREEYHTLTEYWTCDWDQYETRGYHSHECSRYGCRGAPSITDWLNGKYGSKKEAPEPLKIILGSNHFRICRSSPYGFAPFFDISSDMLRDLGTLTVRLDGEPVESIEVGHCWERLDQLLPLNLDSRFGKYGLKEWERLVQRLAECIRPDYLTLYLIVNVKDAATAQAVLKPLYQLPRLKDCGLWLNKEHVPELSMLAQETVKRLKKSAHTEQPFKYPDLPIEVRWRILEYSDLVYDNALEWKPPPSSLGRVPRPFCSCIQDGPHPLFLVSKQVHHDAVPIFFQRNRFLVLPPGDIYGYRPQLYDPYMGVPPPDYRRRIVIPMHRVELSLFLSSLARNALQHIRYLEWLLPQFENYTTAPKSAYLDYLDTIELMAHSMNLPLLTLVVDLRTEYPYQDWELDNFCWPRRHAADGALYDRILQPLCRLEGLKDFFVYLRRVKKHTPGYPWQFHPRLRWAYDKDEMKYEKAVMGANYDSRRRAKPWMNRFETKMWRRREDADEAERSRLYDYRDYDPGLDDR